jgi:hypothetical protein
METINDGLSAYPDIAQYARVNITHYDFRIQNRKDGWAVVARPWANWQARQDANMKAMGV